MTVYLQYKYLFKKENVMSRDLCAEAEEFEPKNEAIAWLFFTETYGKWQVESVDRVLVETDESLLIHH